MRLPARHRVGRFLAVLASAFAAVTCDLVTGPQSNTGLEVEYIGPAVLTVGQTVDFDFRALEGTTPIEGARVRVVSSAPDIIEVQGNEFTPRLFVKARGQATLTATLLGSTLGEHPPFVAVPIIGVVKRLVIDSAAVTFRSLNDTLRLGAEASDFNDQRISGAGAGARWSTTDPGIVLVDSISGRLTARGNGTAQVIARLDSTADTTAVLVQQRLVRFVFAPVNLVLNALSLDTVVTVIPVDAGGTPLAAGAPAFTTSTTALNAGIASVVRLTNTTFQVSSQGNAATATGIRVVDVTGNVADDTLSVSVGQIAQSMVITTAASDTIDAFQDTVRVRARAFDARSVEVQGRAISWTSANTSVATVDQSGLVTGLTAATVNIQAKMDAATAEAAIIVRNTARSVALSLDSARMTTIGDTVVLGATARNRLGATVPGVAVNWQSLDTVIAKAGSAGEVVAAGVGNTRVIATIAGGYADTTRVRVTNDPVSVDIVPATLTLGSIGDSATPAVDIRNARSATLGRTTVSWRSADTTVTVTATGLIIARAAGTTFVTATTPDSARADTLQVTVTNAPETVTLNRERDTLTAPTRTLQYDAVVRNGRNNVIAGAGVNWRSSNLSVASVNAAGLVTALAVGQTLVIGEATGAAGLQADTAVLVVTNDVVSLTVSPTNVTIASVGATAGISADPRNAVGATVSGIVPIWSTSDANVAAVDATGTVTGVAVGTATVTANVAGITAASTVTVTNAPDTINILPAAATLASIDDSTTPAVAFRNALGAGLPRTAAQWSSLDGAIAQVTSDGVIIATGRGTTLISAVNALNPARRDSITVTVTNAPALLNVLRTLDSLPSLNRTIQYSADVFNARGDLIVGQLVTWASRTPSVATVSSTGLATSVGIGSTWIVGTAGTQTDSALLVVSNRAASLVLSPSSLALTSVAETAALSAVARNELGNVIASPAVAWSSANTAVATVSGSGVVTAAAAGSTTVSATVDGITASVPVAVTNYPTTLQITSGNLTLASVGDQATPAATITNGLGAVLPRSSATWTTSNANVATVSADGVVTAVAAGSCTIAATSPDNAALTSAITVTVSDAPATLTIAPAGPLTLTAVGATVTFSATVRNANGVIIASPNPAVAWSSNAAAVTVDPVTGLATAAGPGVATITATAGAATGTATVTVAPAPSGSQSTIGTSASALTADGAATATITVQLRDANGNALTSSGGAVTMTLTGTGTLGAVTDHADGTYTATLTAPTVLGSGTVSAAIAGTGITTGDPLVTYVAGPATKYLVTPSSTSPVAGTAVTVSAQQADAFNNPVTTARTVTWSSTGGGSFAAATSATNAGGVATVSFTTDGGSGTTHSVTATDNVGVTGTSGAIQTIAGVAATYLVTPATTSPAAGSGVTITAQLRDANGNNVSLPGELVTWSKSDANGSFAAPTSITNANGAASVVLTTHTVSGTATTVTATTGGVAGTSVTITTVPSTASAATTTITAGSGTVASGTTTTITVQAKDANGNDLTVSGGIVTLATTLGTVGAVTDHGNGTYTATFTGTTAGAALVTGTLAGSAIASNAPITVTAGAATQIAVNAGNGQSAVVSTAVATPPSVIVRDAGNNPVAGVDVVFTVTGGGGVIDPGSPATVTTGASGIAALTSWTVGAAPGPNALNAAATGLNGSPVVFSATATVGGPSGLTSVITANTASFTTGGSATITVQLRDQAGNDLTSSAGSVVALATTLGTVASVTDNANGTYSAALTSTTPGLATVTGTISGNPITDDAQVTVNVGPVSASQTTATVPTGVAGSVTTIVVQERDPFGNARSASSGATVLATITGANNASGTVVPNANGTYTITYTPTVIGSDAIAITLDGIPISGSPFSSVVTAGAVASFQVEAAGGGAIVTQTAGTSFNVRVTARDANGNTVTTFTGAGNTAVLTSTGTMTGAPITTGTFTNGVLASQAVTITNTGSFTITATRSGGPENGASAAFSVVAGPASATQSTATVPAGQAGAVTTMTVVTRDALGNLRTSSSGTVTGFVVSGANNGTALAVTDNNDGTYTVTYTPANTGTDEIRIRLNGTIINNGNTYFSTVSAGGLHHFTVDAAGGGSIGTQTAGSSFNIRVRARDIANNTVTSFNGTVDLTSSGTLTGAPVATGTFVNGVLASFAVTVTSSGSTTITATNSAGAETGTSAAFTVNPAGLDHFAIEESPSGPIGTQTTGQDFNLRITARDQYDNTVTSFSGSGGGGHKVSIVATGATLATGGGTSPNFSNGVLDPRTVSFSTPGGSVTIAATYTNGTETGTSNAFVVLGPASAATSTVAVSSNTVTSGSPITLTLQAFDAAGNQLSTGGATVVFTRSGGGSNGTISATTDNLDGTYTATFTGTTAGSATTIGATVGGVPTASTQSVMVTHGALDHFAVTNGTGGAIGAQTAGGSFTIDVVAQDAANNTVTSFTGNVTFTSTSAISAGAGPVAAVAGIVNNHAITLTTAGAGQTITATGGGQNGTSNAFTVNPATVASFDVETQGGGSIADQVAGTPFNVRVTARDAFGNVATGFTGTVDLTATQAIAAGGGTTAAFTAGVLASHAVTLNTAGANQTVTATRTSGGAQNGTSNTFTVGHATLAAFLVEADGGGSIGNQAEGVAFLVQVTAQDAFGNTVTSFTSTVDISGVLGALELEPVTSGAFTAGVLTGQSLSFAAGSSGPNRAVTVTDGTNTGTSNAFTVTP